MSICERRLRRRRDMVTLLIMKRIALLLVVAAAACKTTDSAPKPQPANEPTPTVRPKEARPAPSLPSAPYQAPPEALDPARPPDRGFGARDRMAQMDSDGDGKISPEERELARKQRAERMRLRLDTNGDGKLSPEELGAMQGRMKFDDPAALDTNHDGDISNDELETGMQARREQMRQQRQQMRDQAGSAGSAPTP
jgi:hypothetical protein